MSLNLLSPALFVNHRGQTAADQPSLRIWSRVGRELAPDGTNSPRSICEDFAGAGSFDNSAATGHVPGTKLSAYVDITTTAGSIAPQASGEGIIITTGTTDNHQAGVGNVGGLNTLSLTGKVVAFESRVAVTPNATTNAGVICGLAEPGSTANNAMVDDTLVPGAFDFLGFYTSATETLKFGYRTAAGSLVPITAVSQAMTSGTFYKCGFVFDPNKTDDCLTIYIDGALVATVSKATLTADANFPTGTLYGPIAAVKTGAAAAQILEVDFLHCVSLR